MCTGIRLIAENGATVYGRTLEFGRAIESQIIIIPRNYAFSGTALSGNPEGAQWKSRYAVVGANALGVIGVIDGVNEAGLAGGLFYFPGYAEFQEVSYHHGKNSIASWEMMTWILTNFSTVAEVRASLPTININKAILAQWGTQVPVHAIVHDSAGNSMVIEYVQGQLIMHDNILGVITNSPAFDWHETNLRNYVHLTAYNSESIDLGKLQVTPFGQGSGMLGLPGDFTAPSRFVRAAFLSQYAIKPKNEVEARILLFHILDLFDIPLGTVREKTENGFVYESTQWTAGADLTHKKYFWHTYKNRNLHMVNLTTCDLESPKPLLIPMDTIEIVKDATPLK
ncbi:MAG: choloylglycine hydrolase family protein [Candidatus Babeliaceae bacterium]|nr:choloylglycine hydrolase family protein [Candidatus Babeliaceae bacterium]